MCSRQCPCSSSTNVPPFSNLTASALSTYNRTYNSSANESLGRVFLFFTSNLTSYLPEAFKDCYYDWQEDFADAGSVSGQTPAGWQSAAQQDFERLQDFNKSMDFVTLLEGSQQCTGICKPSLFPFSQTVTTGISQPTCAAKFGEGLHQRGPMVLNWLIAGAVLTGAAWLS